MCESPPGPLCCETMSEITQVRIDLQHMHNTSPARVRVAVDSVHDRLGYRLKEVLRFQVRLPQALSHTKQLLTRRARHHKVLCEIKAPDEVRCRNERLEAARRRFRQS